QDGEHIIKVTLRVWDNKSGFSSGYAQLNQDEKRQYVSSGTVYDKDTGKATFTFTIRKYHASGNWVLRSFSLSDVARNQQTYDLTGPGLELTFPISTSNPDYTKPQLDINSIRIQAVPKRPEAPDGETDVTIWYSAWDNNSGLAYANQVLLKPTGAEISQGLWKEEFSKPYWPGNPSEPKTYEVKFILPVGSPPGTWVLKLISLNDKAGNTAFYNFTELGILRPFDVK
ncbi:MAG: hypothetical protein U0946_05485, partial [Patescibacteria group bacterium]|nr:hypothetical protein [Patescibacteria group bacterium]